MTIAAAGYSGKGLADKLGIKPGSVVLAIGAPSHYADLLEPLPQGAQVSASAEAADIVHAFVAGRAQLAQMADTLALMTRAGGTIWISWPKKTSPLFADLTEGGVREFMLPTGWVDVKVCAVDADWSALKFVRRRA
jgi:hypothetical protein